MIDPPFGIANSEARAVIETAGSLGEQHRGDTLGTNCRCPCGFPITAHKWRQVQVRNKSVPKSIFPKLANDDGILGMPEWLE